MHHAPRHAGPVLLALAASAWGAVLLAGGLWLILSDASLLPVPHAAVRGGALAAVAAGQFIFMVLVADRLFPRASRRMVMGLELGTFALFLVGLGALGAGLAGQLPPGGP